VVSVALSPDGSTLAAADSDGTVSLWDLATGQATATLFGHTEHVWSVAFSPDGHTLAAGSMDGTVRLWALG
jgi:WD40 repeat protein